MGGRWVDTAVALAESECPVSSLLAWLSGLVTLAEQQLLSSCLTCRRALPPRKPPTASANAPNKNKEERLQGILQYRNINIKVRLTGASSAAC